VRFAIPGLLICLAALQTLAAGADTCTIIPVPQKVEAREGVFKLRPETRILTDAASQETGRYLAGRLGQSTGFKLEVAAGDEKQAAPGSISLTAGEANAGLGAEGYELTVAPESVAIRAADQDGLFYGVQSLLQLLPPQALGSKPATGVDWQIACVRIEDRPRFKWRGMLLDVSRHFYTKAEVERILDLMALHKLNVFQWHLVDHDGWRIEIKKYPKLTQVGAWRKGIGYGIDPRASTAYGPDGRYGGFYTQEEIREVV
jgi:hexosaminidase